MELSSRARLAYARLYQQYNDIDVFVEDSTYTGVYEKIINRILGGRAKVSRVTPLGPRAVVEATAKADTGPHHRPRLYIVDGDLDLLSRARSEKIKNLYRLNVYSLENLLIDIDAIKNYTRFSCPSLDEKTCNSRCDIDNLFRDMQNHLLPYIVALAIARRLSLDGRVSAINPPSVGHIVRGKKIGPSASLIRLRLREIVHAAILKSGREKYLIAKRIVIKNLRRKGQNVITFAPGKLFALAYVNERVGLAGGVTLPQKAMVSYLAEQASLQNDRGFRAVLKRTAKGVVNRPGI
nr:DUF4435 domain-containing protein [Novosphingobium sp. SG720]